MVLNSIEIQTGETGEPGEPGDGFKLLTTQYSPPFAHSNLKLHTQHNTYLHVYGKNILHRKFIIS